MKKAKKESNTFGLDAFPDHLSIDFIKQAKAKQKERVANSQEKLLADERRHVVEAFKRAIKHDYERVTFHADRLDKEHTLQLIQELMDKFEGRVYGLFERKPLRTASGMEYWPDVALPEGEDGTSYYRLLEEPEICPEYMISLK